MRPILPALALLCLLVTACAPLALREPAGPRSTATRDTRLEARVSHALHLARVPEWERLRIEAHAGVVFLDCPGSATGPSSLALATASEVEGVVRVEVRPPAGATER